MKDLDLEFLRSADNADLQILVDYLTKNKHGESRWTEELMGSDKYKSCYPDHLTGMTDEIVDELQKFGGNTIFNLVRGHGVPYREILLNVAKKLKVNFNKKSSVEVIETNLMQKIFTDSLENMSEEDFRKAMQDLDIKTTAFGKEAAIAAIQFAIRKGGFVSYKIAVIVANAVAKALVGRGLSLAANAALTRWLAVFIGPIGWIFTTLWTAIDIAGPAYRVTIPAVVQIAYMRAKQKYSAELSL